MVAAVKDSLMLVLAIAPRAQTPTTELRVVGI